jgi:protein SCO1/2
MASWSSIARASSLAAVLTAALLTGSCTQRELPIYSSIPEFELTTQTGERFRSGSLKGNVWVADFFFTTCTGPCPRMSSRMRQVQKTFPGRDDFKLVSMTVDPKRDTPAALADYARKFSAEPGRWFFLTGEMEQLHNLSRNVFLLGDVTGDLEHSTRFVLVDRESRIRGYYHSSDSESIQQLIGDISVLLKETA